MGSQPRGLGWIAKLAREKDPKADGAFKANQACTHVTVVWKLTAFSSGASVPRRVVRVDGKGQQRLEHRWADALERVGRVRRVAHQGREPL